jgi:ubiquinone/menaquinone biosynthesis C-methylase UbiE
MQIADNSFDVVMVSFALHEFEQDVREKVFKEVSRVLKPGGNFCVVDFARQDNRGSLGISVVTPTGGGAFAENWNNRRHM